MFENLDSLILHFSRNLSKTAMIWHWEVSSNLEVNDNMLKAKYNLRKQLPEGEGAGEYCEEGPGLCCCPLSPGSAHQEVYPLDALAQPSAGMFPTMISDLLIPCTSVSLLLLFSMLEMNPGCLYARQVFFNQNLIFSLLQIFEALSAGFS